MTPLEMSCMPLVQDSGHVVWKKKWYTFTLGASWQVDIYMIREDQIFVVDVVVTNLTWKTVVMSAISWPIGIVMKLSTITKIHKYKLFHEEHIFISMAMEVHDTPGCDMDHFIR